MRKHPQLQTTATLNLQAIAQSLCFRGGATFRHSLSASRQHASSCNFFAMSTQWPLLSSPSTLHSSPPKLTHSWRMQSANACQFLLLYVSIRTFQNCLEL